MKPKLQRTAVALSLATTMSVCSAATPAVENTLTEQAELVDQQYNNLEPEMFARNQVLYYMERGKIAFDAEDFDLAAELFDKAIVGIEKIYSKHPDAQKARQLMYEEKRKPFKGEAYERAMVFYYRGLLDLMNHDYENARASFESGLLQDSMGQNRDFLQDFATLEYLSGWSGRCAGFNDLSEQSFKRAHQLNPTLKTPQKNKRTLIIGESGIVPFKYYSADLGGELRYWQHPLDSLTIGQMRYGKTVLPYSDELYYQARTRGARIADQIAYSKANTKQIAAEAGGTTQDLAGIAMGIVQVTHLIPGLNLISMGLVGISSAGIAATAAISEFTDAIGTGVDIRQWKMLPNRLYITTSGNSANKTLRYINFVDQYDNRIAKNTTVLTGKGKCQLVRSTNLGLNTIQLGNWDAVQLKLSARNYPIYGNSKVWQEVENDAAK